MNFHDMMEERLEQFVNDFEAIPIPAGVEPMVVVNTPGVVPGPAESSALTLDDDEQETFEHMISVDDLCAGLDLITLELLEEAVTPLPPPGTPVVRVQELPPARRSASGPREWLTSASAAYAGSSMPERVGIAMPFEPEDPRTRACELRLPAPAPGVPPPERLHDFEDAAARGRHLSHLSVGADGNLRPEDAGWSRTLTTSYSALETDQRVVPGERVPIVAVNTPQRREARLQVNLNDIPWTYQHRASGAPQVVAFDPSLLEDEDDGDNNDRHEKDRPHIRMCWLSDQFKAPSDRKIIDSVALHNVEGIRLQLHHRAPRLSYIRHEEQCDAHV